jgi:metallo-beta-lactamase class B
MERTKAKLGLCVLLLFPASILAQSSFHLRAENAPVEPFRIIGNIYYVGATDVTSFLITTPQGHVLIDGGFVETAALIRSNIEKLGFQMKDVRVLLNSHAHFDHAGGLAQLKQWSGARLLISERDAPLFGDVSDQDMTFGPKLQFPAAHVDRRIRDGDTVEVGAVILRAVLTPGHTPGCTTWTMQVHDEGKTYQVVFFCSATVLARSQLLNNKTYPGIANDYKKSFAKLRALPCDVFLAPHGSFFDLERKASELKRGARPNPFIDPDGYRRLLDWSEKDFQDRLEAETRNAAASGAH